MSDRKKALRDLEWLKEQIEHERDFDDRSPGGLAPEVTERILARIQPAIDHLKENASEPEDQRTMEKLRSQIQQEDHQ